MTSDTLQPFEQSFMISPSTGKPNDRPSYLFTPPPDTENFLVETFHQYPHGDFRPTFYNPFEIKHRRRTSRAQLKILEEAFTKYSKPSANVRRVLAQKLNMSTRGVQIWFQNRRAKEKQLKVQPKEEAADKDQLKIPHETASQPPVLFSNFCMPQHIEHSNQKRIVSDKVRSLATNAAMVAVSSNTNWSTINHRIPSQHNQQQSNNIHLNNKREMCPTNDHSVYFSPSWSPSVHSEMNTGSNLNCYEYLQQLTPPLSACAGSTVPGTPNSLDNLYTDPIVFPSDQELYLNPSQPSYLTPSVNTVFI